ncbi:MAG: hypothetical protein Kow00106_26620 [Anaerolineae bacterium]
MDIVMIVLRLLHIFGGILWAGSAFFLVLVLMPAMNAMGQEGIRFRQSFLVKSRFNALMPVASVLTTLAGIILFVRVSDHFNSDWLSSDGGIVLSIGSLAGLMAFGHGQSVTGPAFRRTATLLKAIEAQGSPPTEAQVAELQALGRKSARNARISILLLIIAIVGMSAARYM